MSQKILVTGATGTIGTFVVEGLTKKGANFVALARNEKKINSLRKSGVQAVLGDLGQPDSLDNALNGVTQVFLLSSTSPDAPKLQGNLVNKAKDHGVSKIVKVSSLGTSLDSKFRIARYHGQIEKEIKGSGIEYTFLHPHSFMQNFLFDSDTIKNEGRIYAPMGQGKIGLIDARDIADVAVNALTETGHEDKTYELTGPEAVSYADVADAFSEVLGKTITYVDVNPDDAHKAMIESGMPEWLVDDLVGLNIEFAKGNHSLISSSVEKITGHKPRSIHDFIQDYAESFQ